MADDRHDEDPSVATRGYEPPAVRVLGPVDAVTAFDDFNSVSIDNN